MKRFVLFLLLIPIAFSYDCSSLNPADIGSSTIQYSATGSITFEFENERSTVEDLTAYIRVVPQIGATDESYTGTISKDSYGNTILLYQQDSVRQALLEWSYSSTIRLNSSYVLIPTNPPFPYNYDDFPDEVKQYLEYTDTADYSPEIVEKANELVSGVSDYLTAISRISSFVSYYLEYNMNYAPSNVPASSVFQQKSGVCDEFSSLLISMLRSVNIPARYVNGLVYTNVGGYSCTNFGSHSWVEAYVPGYGWVQIDPTYKEFFWIDSGHIPLYYSDDAGEKIVDASMKYIDASFFVSKPSFSTSLLSSSLPDKSIDFSVSTYPDVVGEGNYALVNITVSNPYNSWLLDTIFITTTEDMIYSYGNSSIPVVVPPHMSKSFYLIFKIPHHSCPYESCTFKYPVRVSLASGGTITKEITVEQDIFTGGESFFNRLLDTITSSEESYSSNLILSNLTISPSNVDDVPPTISFDLQNIGNVAIDSLSVYINYDGKSIIDSIERLYIGQRVHYSKVLEIPSTSGKIDVSISVVGGNLSLSKKGYFVIVSKAPFNLNVDGPSEIDQNEDYTLNLHFSSIPSDVSEGTLTIKVNGKEIYNYPYHFLKSKVTLSSQDFDFGNNTIDVEIEYSDAEGNIYKSTASTSVVKIEKLTFWQTVMTYIDAIISAFKILLS